MNLNIHNLIKKVLDFNTNMKNSLESLLSTAYRKSSPFLLACFMATSLPAPVLAETIKPETRICADAKDCYRKGAVLYERGNYREALDFLQESYKETTDRTARATLLYNIATTYANLRQPQLATEYFTLYIAENPSERGTIIPVLETLTMYDQGLKLFNQKNYTAAVEKFKDVYERVVKMESLRITVLYDIGTSYEQLGRYDLAAEYYTLYLRDGGQKVQDRESLGAKMAVWSAQKPQTAKPSINMQAPTADTEKSFFQQHTWSTVSASVGAASLIGGMVAGYMARSKFNELKNSCAPGCPENDIDTVASRSFIANGLFVLAGIAAGTAAGLYWWESSSATQEAGSNTIHVTPAGVGVQF
ncbi:tetratricopeptide repeat protein [Candidatus Woesearchaeota archaeon]|nr:tetratricopeptide repeat protein [Candidatus Woesearchaeota archaeon]